MKIRNFNLEIIILLFVCFQITVFPQDKVELVQNALLQISNRNITLIADTYNSFIDLDSISTYNSSFVFRDKYNSLVHCILFIAKDSSNLNYVGIFRSGAILWLSNPIKMVCSGSFISIDDINKDGRVDIITQWESSKYEHIWIFSWNGNSCETLNEINSGYSNIAILSGTLDIIDADGDGLKDIVGDDIKYDKEPEEYYTKIYKWDGNKYVFSDSSLQLNYNDFTPAGNMRSSIHAVANKILDTCIINYTILNFPESSQAIKYFYLNAPSRIDSSISPSGWGFEVYLPPFVRFSALDDYEVLSNSKINGFAIKNVGLPGITNFYLQSSHLKPVSNDITNLLDRYKNDIINNSLSGKTIIPILILQPFIPEEFINSILSYNEQSFFEGWIKNQTTSDKYLNYFTTAKAQLQQNNITGVKNTLNKVLLDVDIDSTSNLTSEAYALIKYNTEYLLEHLPNSNPPTLAVNLENSSNSLITGGSLQYYDGGWKDAVNNGDGTFGINTDKTTLSLRMNYAYGSKTISNIPAQNNTYTFHTTNVSVQLKDSQGNQIDEGTVKYYAGGWRDFDSTSNGVATKELLPNNYSFRMIYANASNDKQQNIDDNPTVVFQTVKAYVQLKNSLGNLIGEGNVQYYAGGWREFGTTTNGVIAKELLPNSYSFRMTYAYSSNDKQQNIGDDSTVVFQTVNANVQLKNSLGNLIDEGTVKYYAGGWRDFGTTSNGIVTKELLPNNYSFRMTYAYGNNDKQQNIGDNPTVVFQTVNAIVQLKNSLGNLIDQGTVQYYAGGWRDFGTTTNGVSEKELLPNNYSFRMTHEYISKDMAQNISTNNIVVFSTVLCNVRVRDTQGQPLSGADAKYYSGGWREIGLTTSTGEITKELLPANLSFRVNYNSIEQDKTQNLSTNNMVDFVLNTEQ